jgi:hypothetical protein
MIAETANAPAKLIKDFRKKEEKPALSLLLFRKLSMLVTIT